MNCQPNTTNTRRTFFSIVLACLTFSILYCCIADQLKRTPNTSIMLWEWDRVSNFSPANFSYSLVKGHSNNRHIGIAFLAETIYLSGSSYIVHSRQNKFTAPNSTYLEAVIHIESNYRKKLDVSPQELKSLVHVISSWAKYPRIKSIQIDFDARESERHFYKQFLTKVRQSLPANYHLSITALASWSLADRWINDLPVDEIVPMFFSMGSMSADIYNYIETIPSNKLDLLEKCIGISTDELSILKLLKRRLPKMPARIYLFPSWPRTVNNSQLLIRYIYEVIKSDDGI